MLRQENPFAGDIPSRQPALPVDGALAPKFRRVRRKVGWFWRRYEGIGSMLLVGVGAIGAGFFIGHL
jgi:hypothetical protein